MSIADLRAAMGQRLDRLRQWFPNAYMGGTKHNLSKDFGYPEVVDFQMLYHIYRRSSLMSSGVHKTIDKTWETAPSLWETKEPAESKLEEDIRRHFTKKNIWRGLMNADKRSMIGQYAGAILILRDGKPLSEPVDRVRGGIEALAGIIPAWQGQLIVTDWDEDVTSETYGEPVYFQFDEQAVGDWNGGGHNSVRIHRDRIIIFSEDGTVNGISPLEAGINDIIDANKIKGAGGEGFWKSSRGTPVIQAPQGLSPQDVMRGMGAANNAEVIDKLNEQVDNVASGFDKAYMLGGFSVSTLAISLPQPKEFWDIPAMSFAASLSMPFKILIGNVTGERASTEDAAEWNQTIMSRRVNRLNPLLQELIDRLVRWGILPDRDWTIGWEDLTEATASEKVERAFKMADINAKSMSEPVFLPDEIREAAGFAPSEGVEGWDEFMAERAEREAVAAEDAAVDVIEDEGVQDA